MVRVIILLPILPPALLIRTEVTFVEFEGFFTTVRGAAFDFFLQLHMIDQFLTIINITKFQFRQYLV